MARQPNTVARFGTFGGVFTPCVLTILGVIMFLRLGYVVGQTGVLAGLFIVAIANVITLLTALSLSAIATNTRMKGGGAYFLISRSLGVEAGGAIGIIFSLAQTVSVAMYVIGFSEALLGFGFVPQSWSLTAVASAVNLVVGVCVFIGAGWTIRLQYFILASLAAALLSFYVGAIEAFDPATLQANLHARYSAEENLFTMFALFFPAVTGIMAGANMSGDLKDPGRSIPLGTLAAIGVTAAIYSSEVVLLGGTRPRSELVESKLIMAEIARWPSLITLGVLSATLSSALGSMMGAPRILQALAQDQIFRPLEFLKYTSGSAHEPRRAIVVCFVIVQTCILSADLDAIAPIVTMAFMITYGLLNLTTFYEAITRNPSYRPRFRWCHWSFSLAGAAGCVAVMFLVDWLWALVAIATMGLLHWYISAKEVEARWGDLQSGLLFERARRALLRLEEELYHPKNWRPIILALSGGGWSRPHLAVYGHWFTAGRGILSLGQVIQGEVEQRLQRRINQERLLHEFIREQELQAFPAVVVARYLSEGIESLVQSHGLGALRPNTVLLGWPSDPNRVEAFAATLRSVAFLERSILAIRFVEEPEDPWQVEPGTIDVWWRGQKNGELMLLLAHLLTINTEWRTHRIRLLRVIDNEAGACDVKKHLTTLIETSRIRATAEVVVADEPRAAIHETSRDASLVFLGFEAPEEGKESEFIARMEALAGSLPRVVFVDSVGGMSLET
ncbi:MAG: Na-K-Cl cotransporter [Gemmatales bacterium]|nr:MAG: Na-K-Cl cotransporter [Gemmatales bacterium]